MRPQKLAMFMGLTGPGALVVGAPVDGFGVPLAAANAVTGLLFVGFVVGAPVVDLMVVGMDVAASPAVGQLVVGTLPVGDVLAALGSGAVGPVDVGVVVIGIGDGSIVLGALSGSRSSLLGLATYSRTTSNAFIGLRTVPEYRRGVTPSSSFNQGKLVSISNMKAPTKSVKKFEPTLAWSCRLVLVTVDLASTSGSPKMGLPSGQPTHATSQAHFVYVKTNFPAAT